MQSRRVLRGADSPHFLLEAAERQSNQQASCGFVLWLLLAFLVFGAGCDADAVEPLRKQRAAFQLAERSLKIGLPVRYAKLRHYPLYPYLRYQDISRRLNEFPSADVREFLKTYPDMPLAGRLRRTWLRQLAKAQRWTDYLHDYVPTKNAKLNCWQRQALLNTGQHTAALQDFAKLWLRGSSLPSVCDPVIAVWQTQGYPSEEQRWQRFALAMEKGELGLARFLRKEMSAADRTLADRWLAVAGNPKLILDVVQLSNSDPRIAAILNDGLNRWRRRDALAAIAALDTLKKQDPSLALKLAAAERQLALWVASDYHPTSLARLTALPDAVVDETVREWRVRVCLQKQDWAGVLRWIDQMPDAEQNRPRWRYWRGRALESLGKKTKEAQAIYQSIVEQRDYYAFLAADRINKPYAMVSQPLTIPATELDALLEKSPGLQRAHELYLLGREVEATAEWRDTTRDFNNAQFQQAALLAHRWDWHSQAIFTLAKAKYWDDLDVRFPLAHQNSVFANAQVNGLDAAWIYAVIRQESGFRSDIGSPVGALGLMQIMPATGQLVANGLQELFAGKITLLNPETNIRYGAHYLRQVLDKLQDNPMLATAAYNAGPHKVVKWLPERDSVPADIWAETIPYHETRAYVQRVMEYAAIYDDRLDKKGSKFTLSQRMKPVLPESLKDEETAESVVNSEQLSE